MICDRTAQLFRGWAAEGARSRADRQRTVGDDRRFEVSDLEAIERRRLRVQHGRLGDGWTRKPVSATGQCCGAAGEQLTAREACAVPVNHVAIPVANPSDAYDIARMRDFIMSLKPVANTAGSAEWGFVGGMRRRLHLESEFQSDLVALKVDQIKRTSSSLLPTPGLDVPCRRDEAALAELCKSRRAEEYRFSCKGVQC